MWDVYNHRFEPYQKFKNGKLMRFELRQDEEPALTDRAQALLTTIEKALPNILDITNRINAVLANTANLTSNFNVVAVDARPTVSNLAVITSNIKESEGFTWGMDYPDEHQPEARGHAGYHAQDHWRCRYEPGAVAESITLSLNNLANITKQPEQPGAGEFPILFPTFPISSCIRMNSCRG